MAAIIISSGLLSRDKLSQNGCRHTEEADLDNMIQLCINVQLRPVPVVSHLCLNYY